MSARHGASLPTPLFSQNFFTPTFIFEKKKKKKILSVADSYGSSHHGGRSTRRASLSASAGRVPSLRPPPTRGTALPSRVDGRNALPPAATGRTSAAATPTPHRPARPGPAPPPGSPRAPPVLARLLILATAGRRHLTCSPARSVWLCG